VEHGHRIVHPYDTMVDEVFMTAARARSLEVNVWTLDVGLDRYDELIELGVDGIITDEAAVLATSGRGRDHPASGSGR
jgi:glycerophosphoryl diester phosphodiesterase